jgi:hypothetical protein
VLCGSEYGNQPSSTQQKGRAPFYGRNNLSELQNYLDILKEKALFARPQDIGVTVENKNTTFLVKRKIHKINI